MTLIPPSGVDSAHMSCFIIRLLSRVAKVFSESFSSSHRVRQSQGILLFVFQLFVSLRVVLHTCSIYRHYYDPNLLPGVMNYTWGLQTDLLLFELMYSWAVKLKKSPHSFIFYTSHSMEHVLYYKHLIFVHWRIYSICQSKTVVSTFRASLTAFLHHPVINTLLKDTLMY